MELNIQSLAKYLSKVYDIEIKVDRIARIDGSVADLKGFGYGFPYLIDFFADGKKKQVVLTR